MIILTHHTTRREASELARQLRQRGFRASASACYGYISNIRAAFARNDAERREVIEAANAACDRESELRNLPNLEASCNI